MGLRRSQISIGNYAHPLYSFDRFLACAERLHIQNLELWGAGPHFYFYDYSDERAKGFYQKIAEKGMKVICITPEQCMYPINIACNDPVMRRRSIDYFKRGVDFCRIMDCPMMLVTPGKGYFDRPRQEAWERSVQALREIGEYAHSAGVRIAMEHLTQMSSNVAVTAKEAAALVQAVGLPNVGGMVDTDMAGRIGEGVADFLSAFDNKLAHVHLVDGDARAGIWSPATGCCIWLTRCSSWQTPGTPGLSRPEVMHGNYQLEPEKALERTVRWMEEVFARTENGAKQV